jgi:putative transposase
MNTRTDAAASKKRYRVQRGEPGCQEITRIVNGEPAIENPPVVLASLSSSLPALIDLENEAKPVVLSRSDKIANYRFTLINTLNKEAAKESGPKVQVIDKFLALYKGGLLLPGVLKEIGPISRRTFYRFNEVLKDKGINGLAPQYRNAKSSAILPGERDFLLKFLLNQNQPKISDGIRECKRYLGEYSTTGPSALRRFINDFKTSYHDIWTLKRKSEKAWNDEDAPYQDRDPMLLNVGEVIVADGHKLNLNVIDPLTGKKKRAVLVLFWDWKSTYPLGWEIMFSENIQCIAVALRNALLTLGKIPGNIYIDNGRAFLAKIFTRKIRIEETEIPGMIARLGSQYRRATPYHGQSKPIERFFLIINDRLERRLPSYTGASINDKPAYLLRNEKLAKQLHDDWVPTVDDVFNIMLQWREEYIDEPRPRRQGLTARQIFDDGKGAGLDPKALCFLMMAVEVKSVRRSRFTFAGTDWEGPCLYGYKGNVLIRYSLSDLSKVYVFDPRDQFMGVVTQCGKADPIKDWQAAKRIVSERRKYKRDTKRLATFIQEKHFLIEGRSNPDLNEYIEAEEAKKPQNKIISPWLYEAIDNDSHPAPVEEGKIDTMADHGSPLSGPFYSTLEDWYYEWAIRQDPKDLSDADRKAMKEVENSAEYEKHLEDESFQRYLDRVKYKQISRPEELISGGEKNERPICADQIRE